MKLCADLKEFAQHPFFDSNRAVMNAFSEHQVEAYGFDPVAVRRACKQLIWCLISELEVGPAYVEVGHG